MHRNSKIFAALLSLLTVFISGGYSQASHTVSGRVVNIEYRAVLNATVTIETRSGTVETLTDANGRFSIKVQGELRSMRVHGANIRETSVDIGAETTGLLIKVAYTIPPIAETVTIIGDALTPDLDLRNGAIYENALLTRDDQLMQSLNAGINAGQHEGGGKSLEIRRYGFNLDHGGVNGGLKIVVDNVQQNQGTQGHGQGYLGSLKTLSPELVENIVIINGPFSAAYGDFSGLGVVRIDQREELDHAITARVQGGPFNSARGFFGLSPHWKNVRAFVAYEPSYTDGPFESPLRYRRHNFSGNFMLEATRERSYGIKFNGGTNSFFSSGQLPLDLVAKGELDCFGFIDPENGGRVQAGTFAGYYRQQFANGSILRADAFVGRSLFDLFSNFTFFLADPANGDEIQQHDSRLQQGGNIQFLHAHNVFGFSSLFTAGFNVLANQVNVGLYPSVARVPNRKFLPGNDDDPDILLTSANARINNYAGYVQNETGFFGGRLRVEAGLRFDYFTFGLKGFELSDTRRDIFADEGRGAFQPKLSLAWSPFPQIPLSLYANYGRGILSQDARGIAREKDGPKLATTDFYQTGASLNFARFSAVISSFFIDRSNEQVYIPDDGSVELASRSRSYGIEGRTALTLTKHVRFSGGATKVINAFFPGQFTDDRQRVIVDSAPHLIANASLVFSELAGFNASLSWRHISRYRLDGEDPTIKASGNDVVDLALSRRLNRFLRLNLVIDNLLNKRYFETQNFFESRTCPSCEARSRIHATPGYPLTVGIGLTVMLGSRK